MREIQDVKSLQRNNSRLVKLFLQVLIIYSIGSLFLFWKTNDSVSGFNYVNSEEAKALRRWIVHQVSDNEFRIDEWKRNKSEMEEKLKMEREKLLPFTSEIDSIVSKSEQLKRGDNQQKEEALSILMKGKEKFPNSMDILVHLGGWFYDNKSYSEAIQNWKRASELNPYDNTIIDNLVLAYEKEKDYVNSLKMAKVACDLDPQAWRLAKVLEMLGKYNIFEGFFELTAKLITLTNEEVKKTPPRTPIHPYRALHMPFTVEEVRDISRAWSHIDGSASAAGRAEKYDYPRWDGQRKIKIAYISPDFRFHAVGIQVVDMFQFHNKDKFEVYCIDVSTVDPDFIFERIKENCQHFIHMVGLGSNSNHEVIKQLRDNEIDIAIDLALTTAGGKPHVFAQRPVAIQIAWLGLACTTGMKEYDYIFGDAVVNPEEYDKYYDENVVVLPNSYHIFNHNRYYGNPPPQWEDWDKVEKLFRPKAPPMEKGGLNKKFFHFCNFQNNERVTPSEFHAWMEILRRTPDSILILRHHGKLNMKHLLMTAEDYGIITDVKDERYDTQPNRVVFTEASGSDHISIKGSICDMYLDAHYYNGHSNGGDMIHAGVPGLTFPWQTMASRAVASFYTTSGHPELITNSWDDYIEKGVYYGTHREETYELKRKLVEKRLNNENPLFDVPLFVAHIEDAMTIMMKRYHIDKTPAKRLVVPKRSKLDYK
eukprot:TRINITY_DN6736_c0_g1_i1.p1 TRINITY_DN6736_c0_g1~~TRINITY_DN6736_c0_g1_i1.p1  ORF type:complete len:756 (-),score=193.70 TRINITY_DN6736_c0_g1_i1:96-2216(-)